MKRQRWSIEEVMELEQAVFAILRSHASKYDRSASSVRCKAMNLLCNFEQSDLENVA
jgi:hypothetical protein